MTNRRAVLGIARADFLERVRRYSFLVTLLIAVFLGYAAATGRIVLKLGNYRGVYTSGWIGAMVALVTTTFESFIGFYIVKETVERDRRTGVGEVLAAAPLSKPAYAIGKFISNFAVLLSIVVVLAIAATLMLVFQREDPRFDLWALLSPFLLIAVPAMAVTSALALLFETLPLLRGSAGNVIWFFVWSFSLALPVVTGARYLDPAGIWTVAESMIAAARRVIPGYDGGFSLTIGDRAAVVVEALRWPGLQLTSALILSRIAWVVVAIAIALLAAACFDRFDGSRARRASARPRPATATQPGRVATDEDVAVSARGVLIPLTVPSQTGGFGRVFLAEIRLALSGLRWWWHAVAAGLVVAQLLAPLDVARGPLLATAWLWPLFAWSAMGTRESRYGTNSLVFTSPHALSRQFPMSFLAGVAVAAVTGSGVAVRLLVARNVAGLVAWIAAVLLIPSLALALGVWTGTSKAYEALYTVLWYAGPVNRVPSLDYTGASAGPATLPHAAIYLAIAAALLLASFAARAAQSHRA